MMEIGHILGVEAPPLQGSVLAAQKHAKYSRLLGPAQAAASCKPVLTSPRRGSASPSVLRTPYLPAERQLAIVPWTESRQLAIVLWTESATELSYSSCNWAWHTVGAKKMFTE